MIQPQIIGFGAQKAGTTWLFDNLAMNPGIWRPVLKEMHFFNHVQSGSRWMFTAHKERISTQRARAVEKGGKRRAAALGKLLSLPMLSEEWYQEAYRPCPEDKQSMDITPAYAMLDEATIRYMDEFLGNSFKAIYLIRDPAARAISSVKKQAAIAGEKGASIDYWLEAVTHREVRIRSDYADAIGRMDKLLGDRVLYLPFGMIKRDPTGVLRCIEKHCGLPEGQYEQAANPKHVSPLVALPEGLTDAVRVLLADQYKWLEGRFDSDMLSQL